jgi:hypothetical protein
MPIYALITLMIYALTLTVRTGFDSIQTTLSVVLIVLVQIMFLLDS